MKEIEINLFVPSLDQNFTMFLPINLEMKVVLSNIQNAIKEMTNGIYEPKMDVRLYDKVTGLLINQNNIVKYSGLKNGCSIMLIF